MVEKSGSDWRKKLFLLNRSFHRDIGYFCVGLILIYAISGIAVNHVDSWNPSYVITRSEHTLKHLPKDAESDEFEKALTKSLGIKTDFRSRVRDSADEVLFFYEGTRVSWNETKQQAYVETTEKRIGLFFANYLHLNKAKRVWTYVADVFAVLLIYLSLSGLFMVKGANGFGRRGWMFVTAGIILPLSFYYFYV
ncbi:PepSY-associated TM helix domain-containing protein [Bdellovibrio reynosensis]|uniref:PepSY-associated TM helix domain-containing protein n=1 Tax=Bdellovibrio reynosensis TaxID=2835041 RepID=A0ABY4C985_9BACT|nr:PepSY-associated TM helix domain-containing protein [Bdellovibrio reynosensis]UOF01505.1 PepSY-associated TM helix domain-containing protein [Bdellovibrio reynosensis]